MFWQIFTFELKNRFTSKALWICWAILCVKSVTDIFSAHWELAMPSHLPLNSPFSVYYLIMFLAFWSQMLAVGFMAQPILRDITTNAAPLVFSKPVTNRGYLLGKYLASLIGMIFVMSGPAFAFIILPVITQVFGLNLPVPLISTPYLHIWHAFFIWTVTGTFVFGTMHFALVALSGKIAPSYALAVLFFMIFLVFTVNYEGQEFNKPLMQIFDPLGKSTIEAQIFYWSAEERLSRFISVSGNLLYNRLIYLSFGFLALGLAIWRFDLQKLMDKSRRRSTRKLWKKEPVEIAGESLSPTPPGNQSAVIANSRSMNLYEQISFTLRSGWRDFARLFSLNPFCIVVLIFAVMIPLVALDVWWPKPDGFFLPAALYQMKLVGEMLFILIMLAALFFVGEIVGREEVSRIKPLIDATPVKTWTLYSGKIVACILLVAFLTLFIPLGVFLVQIMRGFWETNPALFAIPTIFRTFPHLLAFALIGVIFYAVLNNKTLAQILSIIFAFCVIIFHEIEAIEHRMLLYALPAGSVWTDFGAHNEQVIRYGYGAIYWLALAGFLLVVGYWLWARGTETRFSSRLKEALQHLRPVSLVLSGLFLIVFIASGWKMYHNINILNDYQTVEEELNEQAEYERKYGALANLAQPKIVDAKLKINLYPNARRADYTVAYKLQNRTDETITRLHLETAEDIKINSLELDGQTLTPVSANDEFRHYVYKFPVALAPQSVAALNIDLTAAYKGFTNEGINGTLQPDGSIFTAKMLPVFGYDRKREIIKNSERKLHNLPVRRKLPTVQQVSANPEKMARNLAAGDDADFVNFQVSVTTDADQTVAAPGKLISDTTDKKNRRTFVFQSERSSIWDFHCSSARYAVTKGEWRNGERSIPIEIYHLPTHGYNSQRLIESAKFALEKLTKDFGDYPHDALRIAEVPNELIEPTTNRNLILLPEKKGWLNDYRAFDAGRDPDFVQFITAREIARGWWGQTASPAEAQGYPLLIDALPTYAALTVIEAKNGNAAAQRRISILTDDYLRTSAIEDGFEPSLLEAEDQEYINEKGAIILFAAQEKIGEKPFNSALKIYLDAQRDRQLPPFTRADEFLAALEKDIEDDAVAAFLKQGFETTTTYDYKLKGAVAQAGSENRFKLRLEIEAKKFQANERDNRVEAAMNEPLEVAIYLADESDPHIVKTPPVKTGANTVELELNGKPARVELDPRRLLIDRNQTDNTATVRFQ